MSWRACVLAASVAFVTGACGVLPGSAPEATPTSVPATAAPTTVATPSRVAAAASPSASPSPRPTTTPAPAAQAPANTVYVANTDGEGVYVRNTPVMSDHAKAYADGTALTVIGDDVDGDGQHWKHVRTPDGLEGYVPSIYTTAAPP